MKRRKAVFSTQIITTCLSTTLVLILLGTIVMIVLSARNMSNYMRENINISVLINDEMDSLQIQQLKSKIAHAKYIKELEYISKEQALKEESKALGIDPSEFLEYNPYTASFELKIKAEYSANDGIDKIVKEIKANKGVLQVQYPKSLIKAVNDNIRKISLVLLIIAGLFTYISFALINNTVQLTIFSKRFTINTMKLVGASWGFIRKPFLMHSILLGIASALAADGLLYAGYYFGNKWLLENGTDISEIVDWKVLAIVGGSVFIFGFLITWFCTLISLNKYLKMSTNKLYYI